MRDQIHAINQRITLPNVRHLKPENLHLTLLYLGLIEAGMQESIVNKASQIKVVPFAFQLDSIAHWHVPRILCLTVSKQPRAMLDLVQSLVNLVRPYPIFLHDRPYRAHVTMVRKVKQPYVLNILPIGWQASEFVLVESCSTPEGIRYEVLQSWPLQ